jgi:LysR family transcriptional activator of nhaA
LFLLYRSLIYIDDVKINYNHLRYFYFVAHEGHLTRAAQQLHISQSALSVQIRTLESQLGHELFERRGKQLILTEVGRLVLDYADAIFRTGDELLYQLTHHHDVTRRVFRIGAITTLSRNFQIEFFGSLLREADVELVVSSGSLSELLLQLETHRLDVVLANTVPSRDAATPWVSHLISEQPVGLIAHASFQEGTRSVHELLSDEPLILPSLDSNIRIAFDALVERLGISVNIKAEINDMTMLRLIAREGIGLTVVPPIVVKDELDSGELREVREIPEIRETFHAIVLKRRLANPILETLLSD